MIGDFHLHTRFSGDSEEDVDQVINAAIKKGMKYMAVTDHNDFEYEKGMFELDVDKYFQYMTKKKKEYEGQIDIAVGIECGLEPKHKERIDDILKSYRFDFIIGSSHVINGRDPYYKEYFENRSVHQAMDEYLESIIENISLFDNFDVYGHLDYMMRYAPVSVEEKRYAYVEYEEKFDAILKALIKKNIGMEINTASLRAGLYDTNPNIQVLQKYKEYGGSIITVGSDAHKQEDVGADFEIAEQMLKKCGYDSYYVFSERKPVKVSLIDR